MARARMLKPDFFRDEELCELSRDDRLLFAGLWTLADRDGRLEYRLKRIKADLFPYDDDIDVSQALDRLSKKFITIYEVNDDKYIEINNFKKHQHPHPKEPKSVIPGKTPAKQCPNNGKPVTDNVLPPAKTSESIPSIPSESISVPPPAKPGGQDITEEISDSRGNERTEADRVIFREAWKSFDTWSKAATNSPLRLGVNLERFVWNLMDALENVPPVILNGQQTPQRLLIPLAIDKLIGEKCPWESSTTSLKYQTRCVQNKLEKWATQGMQPGKSPVSAPAPKTDNVVKAFAQNKAMSEALQVRLDELRERHPNWTPNQRAAVASGRVREEDVK